MTSIKSNPIRRVANRSPRLINTELLEMKQMKVLKPLTLRELPNWLLAATFVFLSASGFKPVWIVDEPLESHSQALTTEEIALRLTKLNLQELLKRAAHAAQTREGKTCYPSPEPQKRRPTSATEAC